MKYTFVVTTYRMFTPMGNYIREATAVECPSGQVIKFMDKMTKGEAIRNAERQLASGRF